jgi:ferredoxin
MNVGIFEGREEMLRRAAQIPSVKTHLKRLIVYDSCKACRTCEEQCDQGAIRVIGEKAVVDRAKCILCGYCAATCPAFALRVI